MTGNDLAAWLKTENAPSRQRLAYDLDVSQATLYNWTRRGAQHLTGVVELAIKAWQAGIRLDE